MKKILPVLFGLIITLFVAKIDINATPQSFNGDESVALIFEAASNGVVSDSSCVILAGKSGAVNDVTGFLGIPGRIASVESSGSSDIMTLTQSGDIWKVNAQKLFDASDEQRITVKIDDDGNVSSYVYSVRCESVGASSRSINDCNISVSGTYTYTGSAIVPSVNVSYGSESLQSSDYSVKCDNNIDAGTATVYVYGNGSVPYDGVQTQYIGVVSSTFTIKPLPVTVTVKGTSESKQYNGSTQKIEGYDIQTSDNIYPVVRYGNTSSSLFYNFTGNASASGKNAGTYSMGLSASQFTNVNENFDVKFNVTDGVLNIEKKNLTGIRMENRSFEYTGDYNPSYRPTGMPTDAKVLYGQTSDNITGLSSRQFKTVGQHDIYYKLDENDPNYTCEPGHAVITITPLTAQLEWPAAYVSDNELKPVVKNLVSPDKCDVAVTITKGTGSIVAKVTGLSNPNYKLPTTDLTRTYEIATADASSSRTSKTTASSSKGNAGTNTSGKSGTQSVSGASSSIVSDTLVGDDPLALKDSSEKPHSGKISDFDDAKNAKENGTATGEIEEDRAVHDKHEAIEEEEVFEEVTEYAEEEYSVDSGVYDSDRDMTYARAVHLASPDRFRVIYVIVVTAALLSVIAGTIFLIIYLKKTKIE